MARDERRHLPRESWAQLGSAVLIAPYYAAQMLSDLKRLAGSARAIPRHRHYNRMERSGVSPFVCRSETPITKAEARHGLAHGHLLVPNVSGFYHGTLKRFWEQHGLGSSSLLVSETHAVAEVFRKTYPETRFVTTDYFLDLQPHPTCDVVWDLCSAEIPDEVRGMDSIVCQATLEHVLDPVQVMRNLAASLNPDGILYVQTHTPAFHYHGYPRDYLRYFPDWFEDVAAMVGTLELLELLCVDGHAFAVYRKQA